VSFAAITLFVTQQVIPKVSVYFFIDSVRKLLDTPSFLPGCSETIYSSVHIVTYFVFTSFFTKWCMVNNIRYVLCHCLSFLEPEFNK
jgi:hypothetical protein